MTKDGKIYEVVKSIPAGKVLTYGIVAEIAGVSNPRYVGYALHHNPDPTNIPCHRVVNHAGRLAPAFAFGGQDEQKRRLEQEGIEVKNGKVDLTKYLWRG